MTSTSNRVREFAPTDYEAFIAGANACYPEYKTSLAEQRHRDESLDRSRYFMLRFVAEEDGVLVGAVEAAHRPGRFHPDRYRFDLWVLPDRRHRGHGTSLYDAGLRVVRGRGALALTAGVKESMADAVEFLRKRGWVEVKRDWESRLPVAGFDVARFATVDDRVAANGIRLSTYAEELARDAGAEQKLFDLVSEVRVDVPAVEPPTPETIEEWRRHWTGSPSFVAEATFLAVDPSGRYAGVSNLERSLEDPSFVWQGLTGVRRDARGKGIAMALKLRTVGFAQAMGVDHIKTWNDQRNRPMLAINEALGFVRQPAWIAMELRLRS